MLNGAPKGTFITGADSIELTFGDGVTNDEVNQIVQSLRYNNSSDTPPSSVSLDWVFSDGNDGSQGDGGALDALGSAQIAVLNVNDAPVVDLDFNDSVASGSGFATTFTENGGRVLIADNDAFLSDVDDTNLSELRVQITNQIDGVNERLRANLTNASGVLVASYNQTTGELIISGNGTVAQYQQVLRTISYENLSEDPDTQRRDLSITVTDSGGAVSQPAISQVFVNAINDAPVFDTSGARTLDPVAEDSTGNAGNTVAEILASAGVADPIVDADAANLVGGIAIISTDSLNGTWEYSLDDGATWQSFELAENDNTQLLLDSDSLIRFEPAPDFNGSASITFNAWDQTVGNVGDIAGVGALGSTLSFSSISTERETATITVTPDNEALVANDDDFTIVEDTTLTGSVIDNDREVDRSTAMVTEVTRTNNGTLTLNADGTFEYIPDADFFGTDTFTYQLEDSTGATSTATVTITVDGTNDAPAAVDDSFTTNEDTPYTATLGLNDLLQNDLDVDGDTLMVTTTPVSGPSHGQVTINPNGTFTYRPDANFFGTDSFTYEVTDGNNGRAEATVQITVNPVNDDPVANVDNFMVDEDMSLTLSFDDLLQNDTDIDGDSPTVGNVFAAANGTVTMGTNGTFTYRPNDDFNGTDFFTYSIDDGNGGMATGTVNIMVNSINDAPEVDLDASDNVASGTSFETTFTENAGPVLVTDVDATITDVDDTNLTSLTVSIVNFPDGADERLSANPGTTGLIADYNDVTGTLTLSGQGTLADYQQVLRTVAYENLSNTPDTAQRTLHVVASDSQGDSLFAETLVNVVTDNDAPVIDTTATFSLPDIFEDDLNPTGSTVGDIIALSLIHISEPTRPY